MNQFMCKQYKKLYDKVGSKLFAVGLVDVFMVPHKIVVKRMIMGVKTVVNSNKLWELN